MNHMTDFLRRSGAALAFLMAAALPATVQAQTTDSPEEVPRWAGRGFAHVSVGVQPTGRTHVAAGSFDLYDQPATFEASVGTGAAAAVDLTGGIRLWENFAGMMSYTFYSDSAGAVVDARIPHPLFADMYATGSAEVGGLRHREQSVHLAVAYVLPLPALWDSRLMVFAGPSIIALSKGVVQDVTVQPGTQDVTGATTRNVSATTLGGHFGFDVQYPVTDRFGAGFLLRWSGGTADVPQVEGGKVKVGGLQVGVGIRYAF